jgi:hypothetical protein
VGVRWALGRGRGLNGHDHSQDAAIEADFTGLLREIPERPRELAAILEGLCTEDQAVPPGWMDLTQADIDKALSLASLKSSGVEPLAPTFKRILHNLVLKAEDRRWASEIGRLSMLGELTARQTSAAYPHDKEVADQRFADL